VAAAIRAGDEVSGVTIMKLDPGLDTGPILSQREVRIRPEDTRASLMDRLSYVGAELLAETLPPYLSGDLDPRPQPEDGVTFADRLEKDEGEIDWTRTAVEIDRKIRAFTPWPGTYTFWDGRRLKVLEASPLPDWRGDAEPGIVVELDDGAGVATGEGALRLEKIQLAGKRAMAVEVFLRGARDFVGSRLGR
jgi:methionyl-tRNA formyltransferase